MAGILKIPKDTINNMKNIWEEIKSLISLQKTIYESAKIITLGDQNITDPQKFLTPLIVFFCWVAPFSYKTFFKYLAPPDQD